MKKNHIIALIILLIVGFASVATTLTIRGTTNVGVNSEDFDVVFIDALLDGKESSNIEIDGTKKHLTFKTDELINVGDKTRLDYRVKNTSTQYNANVLINCTNEENKNIEVNSSFDNKTLPLTSSINMEAQETKSGYIDIEMKNVVTSDTNIEISCTIEVNATSRENYKYSVSFDSDGGNAISDKVIEWNESYGELEVPEKEGYIFLGWYDEFGNKIDEESLVTIKNHHKLIAKWKTACEYDLGKTWEFNYTGGEQEFTVPCDGEYKLETWGAQGGIYSVNTGGYGGYSTGSLNLIKQKIFINVGGTGIANGTHTSHPGGYNGGGSTPTDSDGNVRTSSGGGATHISFVSGILKNLSSNKDQVIIVAGGGGGYGYNVANGIPSDPAYSGGGYIGGGIAVSGGPWAANAGGGTQTSGGTYYASNCISNYCSNGSFGQGASSVYAGAGGGWYGGGVSYSKGAGGSGYIGHELLINKAMYCYNCATSDEESTKTISTTCTSSTPTANCAKQGHGYAKITYLGNE